MRKTATRRGRIVSSSVRGGFQGDGKGFFEEKKKKKNRLKRLMCSPSSCKKKGEHRQGEKFGFYGGGGGQQLRKKKTGRMGEKGTKVKQLIEILQAGVKRGVVP